MCVYNTDFSEALFSLFHRNIIGSSMHTRAHIRAFTHTHTHTHTPADTRARTISGKRVHCTLYTVHIDLEHWYSISMTVQCTVYSHIYIYRVPVF